MTKETLNAAIDAPSLDAALMMEDRQQVILIETADHHEAVAAFWARFCAETKFECFVRNINLVK